VQVVNGILLGLPGYLLAKKLLLEHHQWTVILFWTWQSPAPMQSWPLKQASRTSRTCTTLATCRARPRRYVGVQFRWLLSFAVVGLHQFEQLDLPTSAFSYGPERGTAAALRLLILTSVAWQPKLERVVLVTGANYYGSHLGPYRTPCEESDPRHAGDNYYFHQV
jgi:hypothetical protein